MKVLIIDDSADYRALLRLYLNKHEQTLEIVEYDPLIEGRPALDFDWSTYNVLFLDYNLGPDMDGLDWLSTFRHRPGFPPAIFLTAEGDEYVAIQAIKNGAADYVNKVDLTPARAKELIDSALDYSSTSQTKIEQQFDQANSIIEKIKFEDNLSQTGKQIGYKFLKRLGNGAMSEVYLAQNETDQTNVAIKLLNLQEVTNNNLIQRFKMEAELIKDVDSQHVVKVFESGFTDDFAYMALEFFSRGDLKQRLEKGINPEMAASYAVSIANGLDRIHGVGVIHRDLKPANIMFRSDDSLALADFGISKKMNAFSELTRYGQIIGTPHYMSPEQGEGLELDHRSDIYSLGVIFYELLTGQKPFKAKTPASMIYQHVSADIPDLPKALGQYTPFIHKLMAKQADDRYQTAQEFILDIAE